MYVCFSMCFHTGTKTWSNPTRNVSPGSKRYGIPGRAEICTSWPCSKELHVSHQWQWQNLISFNIIVLFWRISNSGVIKVADFGLTEDMYSTNYFRRRRSVVSEEKVPIRWMAPESIENDIYTEATDVVLNFNYYWTKTIIHVHVHRADLDGS